MLSFTLDTNCIIDIAEARPGAAAIRSLATAHAEHRADVALVAVSASERQEGDTYFENYSEFATRIATLGLSQLPVLLPMHYYGVGFWGRGLRASADLKNRERAIHDTLFPNVSFSWLDFASMKGISPDSLKTAAAKQWRNTFCDRQMYWAHDHNKRDVFVTSDNNFLRLNRSDTFRDSRIAMPHEALAMLCETGM